MFYTFLNKKKNKLDRANAYSETCHANPPPPACFCQFTKLKFGYCDGRKTAVFSGGSK